MQKKKKKDQKSVRDEGGDKMKKGQTAVWWMELFHSSK